MRHDLDPLKDGEPFRHQFGPEDFEDELDTRERQASTRDNERRAELLRVGLKRFERNFDIRVSNDGRSGAMCYHCKELFTGNRSKPTLLARLLTAHTRSCTVVEIKPAFAAPYLASNTEGAFS